MRLSAEPLLRFRFVLTVIVILLLMLSVMQWFTRFYAAGGAVESALLGRQFSEQLSLVHGQWLSAHRPEKIWLSSIPNGYFLMASSGWPTDWIRNEKQVATGNPCEHLWLVLMGGYHKGSMIKFREHGCQFLFENQRVDYIFANGNVMVHETTTMLE